MSRLHTILALLVTSATLAAAPALAADMSSPGAHGSADASRAAPEVLVLPGKVTPRALPVVDTSLSRGLFDANPTDALQSLSTVTLDRDGTTSETPASDTLRGIFEEKSKGHHS